MPVLDTLKLIAPALAVAYDDTQLEAFIALATCFVSASVFGCAYSQALAFLAAHIATLSTMGASGAAGPVTGERAGEVSRNYAQPAFLPGNHDYALTAYGRRYLEIRNTRVGTKPLTTGFSFGCP